ncbi:Asp-tRNA(Asn)/Glu-tRNA(Gln) amidotransferase subunit GatB [Anaerosalibacter bizertensis]|uniref:Aspartyl/glutamyl-tRNA(Asn/Gln) amidotransferase subunit B n=1 Tax=Anaerosalibacter bizertensis TaxID=932217 RepID=A0A9Q4AAZ2_9FIRM|nr:Asp-tRNA(Asn)/Glu-tRNA(Gln) amidotransferase subunit GatB [Anaerosalibacter bizertensis]MBV1819970.1 Asp-tRNA(Asn)/Glu-tRNA(Gln) amidotransferase subunit GatB [Bacteroidales bacterium MSK.15.36]MCG4564134.1 Asp-tRNA(Asn)/Glu-tRNA(Gln) amidotransferase subunit GatB [Anaerosalibacter bizertensis]MCG4582560.1 Asp-tRNA(Asn)/Glu-tRNA(Gln) amidotransferase subunit GatB [Anaerosalibacter bizertensis]
MAYKTIIGLEIHSELMTNSKIFCNCTTEFGGDVNTHCCPVCLGLPGALPVINKRVVEYGIKAGLAFNSKIARETKMDRKNYFYPDLVKGYQISQDDIPLCSGGFIEIEKEDGPKKIRLRRIHIEEDTGKSLHSEDGGSLLDYNRSGVPLIEIVTEPDMNSPEEAKEFLEKLKATLEYIEVSDVKMEEGSLRCDVNINVVDEETGKKTSISELKNLNSFKAVVKALEYEEKRHISLLKEGKENLKETRRWDEVNNETIVMRIKEGAADYRYFPEPDLIKLEIEEEWIEDIKNNLPELPHDKKERFMKEYDLPEYDAGVLTQSKALAAFYEETVKYSKDPKQVSNWVMGDVLRRINDEELDIKDLKFTPKDLGDLLELIEEGKISNNIGKKVLRDMFDTGKSPNKIVKEKGLIQISDEGALKEIVEKVIEKNEQSVIDYKDGKDRALGFLVGQVMKETRGKANPQLANKLILEIIDEK